jgi:outer membrane lipoprotein-sorting protein
MKKLKLSAIFLFAALGSVFAQYESDAAAKNILDKTSQTIQKTTGIKAEFSLQIKSSQTERQETTNGSLWLKGNKLKISLNGTDIFFDGKTQWIYVEENNEVTIGIPTEEELLEINPVAIISSYKKGYMLKKEDDKVTDGKPVYVINVYPEDRSKPYHRIELIIEKSTHNILQINTFGKNGVDISVKVTKYATNQNLADNIFVFDTKKYTTVEIIDLR